MGIIITDRIININADHGSLVSQAIRCGLFIDSYVRTPPDRRAVKTDEMVSVP